MTRIFQYPSSIKLPQRRLVAGNNEYGRAEKGFTVCSRCHNILYKKQWREPASLPNKESELFTRDLRVSLCPACTMVNAGLYEGEIIVENLPDTKNFELVNLVRAYHLRSTKREPQHRIIAIERRERGYRITTTENQMAAKLAKKIAHTLGSGEVAIAHSREPFEVERIHITFPE